ncbi:hypothetical protein [Halobellus ordinarius]|nr:hypothetical protein [Halobellus sp. ZY16]
MATESGGATVSDLLDVTRQLRERVEAIERDRAEAMLAVPGETVEDRR